MNNPLNASERIELIESRELLLKIRILVRSMDRGVGYRRSGDHDTFGSYTEGKHDFAGEVEILLDGGDLE